MSSEWSSLTLKEAGVVLIDCDHRTPPAADEGYPYIAIPQLKNGHIALDGARMISQADYIDWTKKLKPQANDVIVVRRCNSGDSAHVPAGLDCAIGQNLVILRASGDRVLPSFLRWLLKGPQWWNQVSKFINVGAVFDSLRCRDIPNFELTIPPLDQQDKIASILGAIDDRITLLRGTNATLEAIAQALFKSWFVNFDPVHDKAKGVDPEGMDAATAALFPDTFEESELGLVPSGWKVRSVYDVARVIYGAPFASKRFNTEGVGSPLVRIRDLKHESPGVYTDENHPKGYMIQPGDLVVGMDGEFRAYLWGGSPAWLNQRVCVFAPEPGVPAAFIHRSIMPLLAAVEASETATTVIHLGKNDIDRFRVVVPSQKILAGFAAVAEPIYARIVENKQTAFSLSALRDTLLPRLISGQLRLPETEAFLDNMLSESI
ncbi:restriction endonuclease subunit S [Pseudomonas lactis]|uniref:restriction endonuclease subunit S n=1 Tax=Pseudomonas lactis TaxID=1615674 RepID=UPI0019DA0260|nr:restriction endonuclease subunit S [Pseudomonas lactis]MBA6042356.1 restriction endonuclease subunit S [Pseudomonas lactis]